MSTNTPPGFTLVWSLIVVTALTLGACSTRSTITDSALAAQPTPASVRSSDRVDEATTDDGTDDGEELSTSTTESESPGLTVDDLLSIPLPPTAVPTATPTPRPDLDEGLVTAAVLSEGLAALRHPTGQVEVSLEIREPFADIEVSSWEAVLHDPTTGISRVDVDYSYPADTRRYFLAEGDPADAILSPAGQAEMASQSVPLSYLVDPAGTRWVQVDQLAAVEAAHAEIGAEFGTGLAFGIFGPRGTSAVGHKWMAVPANSDLKIPGHGATLATRSITQFLDDFGNEGSGSADRIRMEKAGSDAKGIAVLLVNQVGSETIVEFDSDLNVTLVHGWVPTENGEIVYSFAIRQMPDAQPPMLPDPADRYSAADHLGTFGLPSSCVPEGIESFEDLVADSNWRASLAAGCEVA